METEVINWFDILSGIDCKGHTEEKNGFTYLSWPYALQVMTHYDPAFQWGLEWVVSAKTGESVPYVATPVGVFVQVWATFQGKRIAHLYPVLDYKNNPVPMENVNTFDINTAQMRGMVKVCAMHGLGIYIFEGKGAPGGDDQEALAVANRVKEQLAKDIDETLMAEQCYAMYLELNENQELILRAWSFLDPKTRRVFKDYRERGQAAINQDVTGEERK